MHLVQIDHDLDHPFLPAVIFRYFGADICPDHDLYDLYDVYDLYGLYDLYDLAHVTG